MRRTTGAIIKGLLTLLTGIAAYKLGIVFGAGLLMSLVLGGIGACAGYAVLDRTGLLGLCQPLAQQLENSSVNLSIFPATALAAEIDEEEDGGLGACLSLGSWTVPTPALRDFIALRSARRCFYASSAWSGPILELRWLPASGAEGTFPGKLVATIESQPRGLQVFETLGRPRIKLEFLSCYVVWSLAHAGCDQEVASLYCQCDNLAILEEIFGPELFS